MIEFVVVIVKVIRANIIKLWFPPHVKYSSLSFFNEILSIFARNIFSFFSHGDSFFPGRFWADEGLRQGAISLPNDRSPNFKQRLHCNPTSFRILALVTISCFPRALWQMPQESILLWRQLTQMQITINPPTDPHSTSQSNTMHARAQQHSCLLAFLRVNGAYNVLLNLQ